MTRVLVVEDEPPAQRLLQRMLRRIDPGMEVVVASDAARAREALGGADFDAVFLDVQLPGESGIRLGNELRDGPPVIFVTAYRHFAVDAFAVRAVDYLVKPVDPVRLHEALKRVRDASHEPVFGLRGRRGVRLVSRRRIVCVCGQGDYTEVWLDDGTSELVGVTMTEWASRLGDDFLRAHRSTLVRWGAVVALRCSFTGSYTLEVRGVPEPVKISRRAAAGLKARFPG